MKRICFRMVFLPIIFVLLSCNKYADKVDGTYNGILSVNDSTTSSNANIIMAS